MAQRKPNEKLSFEQVQQLVDALLPEERVRLYRHLQFRFLDDEWNQIRKIVDKERAARGLEPATDEDLHDALDAMRTAEEWDDLRHEIQKGLDQLDRGEGLAAERVIVELRERNRSFRNSK
jgi:hypothetical protein